MEIRRNFWQWSENTPTGKPKKLTQAVSFKRFLTFREANDRNWKQRHFLRRPALAAAWKTLNQRFWSMEKVVLYSLDVGSTRGGWKLCFAGSLQTGSTCVLRFRPCAPNIGHGNHLVPHHGSCWPVTLARKNWELLDHTALRSLICVDYNPFVFPREWAFLRPFRMWPRRWFAM